MMKKRTTELPSREQVAAELRRERYKRRYRAAVVSTISALITVSAAAVLVATLLMPVLRIYGSSMTPTLSDGQIVVSVKTGELEPGDVVAFSYNNKILIKRVICGAGDWVDIRDDGTVLVNGEVLDEPYLTEKALGTCDIALPYQVPDGRVFVMGDHRSTSVDSRSTAVGCVAQEQIVGRIVFRVWPVSEFGFVD